MAIPNQKITFKIGDSVTFDSERIGEFKNETDSDDKDVQDYRNLILAGVNQVGVVRALGENLITVYYPDGWELPVPTKYLILLPNIDN